MTTNNDNRKKSLKRMIEDFLASYKGKVILNYAYSWGAAVVILGTLFKLIHMKGADLMLIIGMGTEVLVFFISAFDRPYKSYKWESVFPKLKIAGSEYDKRKTADDEAADDSTADALTAALQGQGQPAMGGGAPIIIGGGFAGGAGVPPAGAATAMPAEGTMPVQPQGGGGVINLGGMGAASITPGVEVSPEMEEATKEYLEQLKEMTGAITSFVDQTKHLGQDAEQINVLNKNLSGINAIYEIQLRNISTQLGTIDEINEQTRKMAQQIEELNKVYARMLEAMTVNMKQ